MKEVSENEVDWCPDLSETWVLLLEDESGTARSLSLVGQWYFNTG